MAGELEGKLALVLGASKGIGFGIAKAFDSNGARVAIASRNSEGLQQAVASLGRGTEAFVCDTGSLKQIDALHKAVVASMGHPDILVLNSGGPPPGPATGVDSEKWRKNFEFMFVGLVRLADLTLPAMIQGGYGRILSVVSSGVIEPIPNLSISNTIRPALVGWGKSLAREVAAHGVTVNAIVPGRIETDRLRSLDALNAKRRGLSVEDVKRDSCARIPAARYGGTDEFGEVASFLASPRASYVTGSLVRVDGGLVAATS